MLQTIIGGVVVLQEMLQNFGPVQLNYLKAFFPEMEKLAASSVAGIRYLSPIYNCFQHLL